MAISQFPLDLLRGAPQQAQPQAVTVPALGDKQVFFGPNVPPEERKAALDSLIAQQNFNQQAGEIPPLGRVMARLFTDAGEQMNQPSQIPYLKGNIFGMSSDQLNQSLGMVQQARQTSAYEKMRQRVATEKAIEAEQDRQQQIKLEEMRLKNQMALEKMRAEMDSNQPQVLGSPSQGIYEYSGGGVKELLAPPPEKPETFGSPSQGVYSIGADGKVNLLLPPQQTAGGGGGGGATAAPKAFSSSSWAKHEDGNEYVVNRFTDGTWAFAVDQSGKMLPATEEVKRAISTNQGIMAQTNLGGTNLVPLTMPGSIPQNTAQPPADNNNRTASAADWAAADEYLSMNDTDYENATPDEKFNKQYRYLEKRGLIGQGAAPQPTSEPATAPVTTQPNVIQAPDGAIVELTD